jgi:hypothetical protein
MHYGLLHASCAWQQYDHIGIRDFCPIGFQILGLHATRFHSMRLVPSISRIVSAVEFSSLAMYMASYNFQDIIGPNSDIPLNE